MKSSGTEFRQCYRCYKTFPTYDEMAKHAQEDHVLKCTLCEEYECFDEWMMKDHLEKHDIRKMQVERAVDDAWEKNRW
jgi:hypothetical protein